VTALASRPALTGHLRPPRSAPRRALRWLVGHWLFTIVLAWGVVLRVIVSMAYAPAITRGDSADYLSFLTSYLPGVNRPDGYSIMVLWPVLHLTHSLAVVPLVQHVMGIAMGLLAYVMMRRWGVWRWLAALGTIPLLWNAYQLQIEQTILSDTIFELLLMLGILVLTWRSRPGVFPALLGGLFFGAAVTVRLVGEPLVLAGVMFLLLVAGGWLRRTAAILAMVIAFAVPVGAYATFYHHQRGQYALSEFSGKVLYGRVTPFVQCSQLDIPDYDRVLCPTTPISQRENITYYVFNTNAPISRWNPPAGVNRDKELRAFALETIRKEPKAYAEAVAGDFWFGFSWHVSGPNADTWQFVEKDQSRYAASLAAASRTYGGATPHINQGLARFLDSYQNFGYMPGSLLFVFLVLGLLGGVGVGRARRSGMRAVCLLYTVVPAGLLLLSAATAQFSWRYQLPGMVLFPMAGAMGLTALLHGRRSPTAGPVEADETDRQAMAAFAESYGDVAVNPVTIVIAAYNEGDAIDTVLSRIPEEIDGLAVSCVVVDDGSSDDTTAVVAAHGTTYACRAPQNRGQGAALRLGYRIARERGAIYIATTDADGQYDITELPDLLAPVIAGQADFVTGSRRLGNHKTTDSFRHLGVHVFAWLVSAMCGRYLTDTSFGLRVMRAELTGVVTLRQPQYQSSELLLGALSHGYRVLEVPATMHLRAAGNSKKGRNVVYGYRYSKVVFGTWWREGALTPVTELAPALLRQHGPTARERAAGTASADATFPRD